MKAMLASKWDATKNGDMFPFWAQPKLDGIRVLVGEDGYLYTRSLKPIRSEHLQHVARMSKDLLAGMDGEIIVGSATAPDCYRRTSSAVMSYDNPDVEFATLQVFDIWNDPLSTFYERYGNLTTTFLREEIPEWVSLVKTTMLNDMKMLEAYESSVLRSGHEGVILRKSDQYYKTGRGSPKKGELIKMKRFADEEGVIVAVHEEKHNANPATINALGHTEHTGHKENLIGKDTLGAIEVKLGDQWNAETVRIGTGFSASQRQSLWAQDLIGQVAKFKYFEIGVKDAPRFPVFLGFRDTEDMESTQGELI